MLEEKGFKNTLGRFEDSYEKFIAMYHSGEVYISKKVDVYDMLDNGDDEKLMKLVEDKKHLEELEKLHISIV